MPFFCERHEKIAVSICSRADCSDPRLICDMCAVKDFTHMDCTRHIISLCRADALKQKLTVELSLAQPGKIQQTYGQVKQLRLLTESTLQSVESRVLKLIGERRSQALRRIDDLLQNEDFQKVALLLYEVSELDSSDQVTALVDRVLARKGRPFPNQTLQDIAKAIACLKQLLPSMVVIEEDEQRVFISLKKGGEDRTKPYQKSEKRAQSSTAVTRSVRGMGSSRQLQTKQVQYLNLRGIKLSRKSMGVVASLQFLQILLMEDCGLEDEHMEYVKGLPLVVLDLSFNGICYGVDQVNPLTIEQLSLYKNRLCDEAIPSILKLANLQRLDLFGNRLTRYAIHKLVALKKLTELNVSGNLQDYDPGVFFGQSSALPVARKEEGGRCEVF